MWQANDSKFTGLKGIERFNERKKSKGEQRPLRTNLPIQLLRIDAKLRTYNAFNEPTGFLPVRLVLSDIAPSGVLLFSRVPLSNNDLVAMSVEHPLNFYIRGRVIGSQLMRESRLILSPDAFVYRIAIKFEFTSAAEAKNVRQLCQRIFEEFILKKESA